MKHKRRTSSRGVLFVAIGRKYAEQALLATRLIRREMSSEIGITLVTDQNISAKGVDNLIIVSDKSGLFYHEISKFIINCLIETPYDETLYLDVDAFVVDDIKELFTLLSYVDLALAIDATEFGLRKMNINPAEIPESFPEFQCGVIAYRNEPSVIALFSEWSHWHSHIRAERDQVSFRIALFNNIRNISFSPIANVYNYPVSLSQRVQADIKIVHDTRTQISDENSLRKYAEILNRSTREKIVLGPGYSPKKVIFPLRPFYNRLLSILNLLLIFTYVFFHIRRSIYSKGIAETVRIICEKLRTGRWFENV